MSRKLSLTAWLHPTMQTPFSNFELNDHPIVIGESATIGDLMNRLEDLFRTQCEANGSPFDFQTAVLWNVKDDTVTLNPSEEVGRWFETGDSFGIHGDFQQMYEKKWLYEEQKIPVTILTGFLGAGKTTLLNYILQEQREKRIAVIENEFGEVSIDDALLKQDKLALAEKVVVMDNGCMCCTIRGDLEKGLRNILDEINKGTKIDAIIIETTGMADPVPIVRTFMSSKFLTVDLRLDGIIALADVKHLEARLDDQVEEGKVNEAYQQIAFADKIILNKLDLVPASLAIRCKDRIRDINKFAKILPAVRGRVRLAELSDMRAHDMSTFSSEEMAVEAPEEVSGHLGEHGGGHGEPSGHSDHSGGHASDCQEDHGHGDHDGHVGHGGGHGDAGHGASHVHGHGHGEKGASRHDSRVNSMSIVREGDILPEKLGAWMGILGTLSAERGTIFRIKGIFSLKNHPYKHVFHAVMDVSEEDDVGEWAEGEKRISKIVFIGKSLDQEFFRDGFNSMFES